MLASGACGIRAPQVSGKGSKCQALPPVSPGSGCHRAQADSLNSLALASLQRPSCLEVTRNNAHGPKSQSWFHLASYSRVYARDSRPSRWWAPAVDLLFGPAPFEIHPHHMQALLPTTVCNGYNQASRCLQAVQLTVLRGFVSALLKKMFSCWQMQDGVPNSS